MKDTPKPAFETILGNRTDIHTELSTNEHLIHAQEKFPDSKLVSFIVSFSDTDTDMLDYALNIIGGSLSNFGIYEEEAADEEIKNITELLSSFIQEQNYDEKRVLAKKIAALVE